MTLNRRFFGVDENDKGFNLDAAIATYQTVMKMSDEEARAFGAMLAFESIPADIEAHREEVDAVVNKYISKRLSAARGIVPEGISKAFDPNDYPSWERSRNARDQMRDAKGRFRVDHRAITPPAADAKPIKGSYAQKLGIPKPDGLTKRERAQYQDAYLQVKRVLEEYKNHPGQKYVDLHWGNGKTDPFSGGTDVLGNLEGSLTPDAFKRNRGLAGVSVGTARDWVDMPSATFDVVGALGGTPSMANNITGATQNAGQNLNSFEQVWNHHKDEDAVRPTRFYRRLSAGSKLAEQTIGQISPKARIAAQAGSFVGQHGPEAQKVLGPTADRAAYRYRGVERKPAEGLQRTIDAAVRSTKGDTSAARDKILRGTMEDLGNGTSVNKPSPLINYFRNRLPKQELNTLQRKSGTIPPSEGIIINNKGKVVSQAVGYGEDWYLPFNLTNVGRLKGGEYIRTRTFGGPTTEDIYTGLISGARGLSVVSHNGVYVVEFDDTFRGGRRFNDKAARMVKRYGELLDAVKSEEVAAESIPPDVIKDIEEQALGIADPETDEKKYNQAVRRLEADWRKDPKMSYAEQQRLPQEFLTNVAENVKTRSGEPLSLQDMVNQGVNTRLEQARAMHEATAVPGIGFVDGHLTEVAPPPFDEAGARASIAARWNGPNGLRNFITDTGLEEQYTNFEARKNTEFRSLYTPMRLDGEGYYNALKALQEQFPYYIADVHYEPWVQNPSGRRDTGYIKPRFTRPEAALSSYYDTSITGKGKISADQTRYQNWPIMQNRDIREQHSPKTEEPLKKPTGASTSTGESEFMALVKHVKSQTKYGAGGKGAPYNAADITPTNPLGKAWGWVLGESENELRQKFIADPAGMRQKMADSLTQNESGQVFDLDSSIVSAFKNYGAAPVPFSMDAYRANPDQKWDFGPGFIGSPGKTPQSYRAVLGTPGMAHARQLMADHGIDWDQSDFYSKIDALVNDALKDDQAFRDEHSAWERGNQATPEPKAPKGKDKDIEALLKLRRLGELYDAANAAPAMDPNAPQVLVVNVDPNQGQGLHNGRTISGTTI